MLRDQLRNAVRSLVQDGRVTATAICLLAITIGATTAIFAIVQAVVLRPLSVADQDRLAIVWQRDDRRALPVIEVAYGEMEDWRARSRSFDDMAVVSSVNWSVTLAGGSESEYVPMAAVSASFFHTVGATPFLGRPLAPADEQGRVARAMVISHGLWLRRFGGDPSVVGRSVPVLEGDGKTAAMDIVGVMPEGFGYPRDAEAWVPAAPLIRKEAPSDDLAGVNLLWLRVFYVLGRLSEGTAVEDAGRELTQVMRSMDRQGGPEAPQQLIVMPIADHLLGPAGPVLRTLLGGAALMLLIACANIAGLHVSRAARRQRGLAIRAALGASARTLTRQIVMESVLLTFLALAGAVALAFITVRGLVWLAPPGVPRLDAVTLMDWRVLSFGACAAFATVALCAWWPVAVARRVDALSVLARGPNAGMDPRGRRVQRVIVVAQMAIALMLLAGTALFLRSVRGLDQAVLGFEPQRLFALPLAPRVEDVDRWNAFYDAVLAHVETLPGVDRAAGALSRPLSGPLGWDNQPIFPGQPVGDPSTWGLNPHVNLQVVTAGYFETLGIRLVRGRLFDPSDVTTAPGVVVVSETTARRLWPGQEAIGQQLGEPTYRSGAPDSKPRWQTVVGIVEDVRYRGLNDIRLDLYVPASQSTNQVQHLMVRSSADVEGLAASVRSAALRIAPNAHVGDIVRMQDVVATESAPWRFLMRVFVAFATLAAVLTSVGLGAVVALTVTARRRELAIRAALGADRARLRGLVLREAAGLVGAGLALGLLGSLVGGRGVGHLLIGVSPHDGTALGCAVVVATAAGAFASWFPARRAADADPLEALRAE